MEDVGHLCNMVWLSEMNPWGKAFKAMSISASGLSSMLPDPRHVEPLV